MRALYLLAILLAGILPATAQSPAPAGPVVEITRLSDHHLGAGVRVPHGFILTAAHVVRADTTVLVRDDHDRQQIARVVSRDAVADLAILVPNRPALLTPSALSCKLPPIGLAVHFTGHPFGRRFVSVNGTVAGFPEPVGAWPQLVPLDKRAVPGMSGGPVMDGKGRIVALVVASIDVPGEEWGPAGAVPGDLICGFLARVGGQCPKYLCTVNEMAAAWNPDGR